MLSFTENFFVIFVSTDISRKPVRAKLPLQEIFLPGLLKSVLHCQLLLTKQLSSSFDTL